MNVQVNNVNKYFEKKIVIDDCSFCIDNSSCKGLIGRNGAGKSTLLKVILGIIGQSSGSISYNGIETLNQNIKGKIGFYLDKEFLPDEMSGLHFIEFIDSLYNKDPTSSININSLVNFFFENVSDLNKLIKNFSFGMKQKIGICAAFISKPDLLVLDEPFAGLDSLASNNLINLLNQYKKSHSVIISSHDLHYLQKFCDDLVVIESGKVVYNGSVEKFTMNGLYTVEESLFKTIIAENEDKLSSVEWLLK